MSYRQRIRYGGIAKFIAILGTMLTIGILAIEGSRRLSTSGLPAPLTDPRLGGDFPRELSDALGEKLVIAHRPKRIASQTLGTDEILLAICSSDRIVALSSLADDETYSNVVEESHRITGRATEGAEQILQLQPDLIFVASYTRAETVAMLNTSHAPVFRFANFDSIAAIQKNIRIVGYAVGCDAEAETLVQRMDDSLAAVRARIPPNQRPLHVMSFGQSGDTAGANTTFDAMVRAAGAINTSAEHGIDGFAKISVEKVAEWQPDFIVAGAGGTEIESVRKALATDPVIAASRAGRERRIIVIDNRHFLTVSQYVVRGVEDLAAGLYGK